MDTAAALEQHHRHWQASCICQACQQQIHPHLAGAVGLALEHARDDGGASTGAACQRAPSAALPDVHTHVAAGQHLDKLCRAIMQKGEGGSGVWPATGGGGGCMAASELAGRRTSVGAGGEHGVVLEERADAGEIQLVNLWVKTESQTGQNAKIGRRPCVMWGQPGIEPGTSRIRIENNSHYTTVPSIENSIQPRNERRLQSSFSETIVS